MSLSCPRHRQINVESLHVFLVLRFGNNPSEGRGRENRVTPPLLASCLGWEVPTTGRCRPSQFAALASQGWAHGVKGKNYYNIF